MNTVRSFWLGWGSVCVAGAGAYYFAKREINADRQAKLEAARNKKQAIRSMEYAGLEPASSSATAATAATNGNDGAPAGTDTTGSPSQEVSRDHAATRHAAVTEPDETKEKSRYESAAPYRSRKGDRFS